MNVPPSAATLQGLLIIRGLIRGDLPLKLTIHIIIIYEIRGVSDGGFILCWERKKGLTITVEPKLATIDWLKELHIYIGDNINALRSAQCQQTTNLAVKVQSPSNDGDNTPCS